jgi:hypothetical protein
MGRICALAANSYGVFPSSAFRRCMVLMDVSNRMLVSEVAFRLQSTVLAEADDLPRHLGSRSIHCAKVRVSERRLVGRPNPCILARVFLRNVDSDCCSEIPGYCPLTGVWDIRTLPGFDQKVHDRFHFLISQDCQIILVRTVFKVKRARQIQLIQVVTA